jgi:photosystem II stability/assembly factor-like uncharacterized protein
MAAAQPGIKAGTPSTENLARLPMAFERSRSGAQDRYIARGQGYIIGIEDAKATICVGSGEAGRAVSLEFKGSHPGKSSAGPELPGKVNIIRGNDPGKWQLGLSTYQRVSWPNVYPGIDVVYYGNQQQLEFDVVVKPGADPRAIRLKVAGGGKLSIDGSGALNLGESADGLRVALPQIYQEVKGIRKNIRGHYAIVSREEVAFRVDAWDRTRALVIDPTIVYSTLFGGGLDTNSGNAIQVDAFGNILLAGVTHAADFPTVNAAQSSLAGIGSDAFVSKINPAGTALIYSTYLGGSSDNVALALAVDSSSSAWVTGYTSSGDFPTLNAAQSAFGGGFNDAFVARLSSSGVLQLSTYLGGSNSDYGYGIAVDSSNNAYVTGFTDCPFPTTPGTIQPSFLALKAFVTKYSSAGVIVYSTLLGGNSGDVGYGIAVDSTGQAYVTGQSGSSVFAGTPPGGAQLTNNSGGGQEAFVAKLNSTGTGLAHFTFFGAGGESARAIAVDASGSAYIAGQTYSAGLATAGAAQTTMTGVPDGFVAKLNADGNSFDYVTYLGGSRNETIDSLALDGSGNVYVAGYTDSADFPVISPVQSAIPGNSTSLLSTSDSGASWSAADTNIPGAVFDVSVNPSGISSVVLTEGGIYRTTNGGSSWAQKLNLQTSSGNAFLSRSTAAAAAIYAALSSNVYRSTDDGVTWTYMGHANSQALRILADPLTATTLYLFGYSSPYLFKSTDGGATWNPAASGLPAAAVSTMTATSDGALFTGIQGYGVYKSTNQGAAWVPVNNGVPSYAVLYQHSLSATGTTVYLATGALYATTNGGSSWTPTLGNVGAAQVSVSPLNPSVVYAVTLAGTAAESSDGGSTWTTGTGLPSTLQYSNAPTQIVANPTGAASAFLIAPVNQAAFVAKLNSTGSALTWSTYLGIAGTHAYGVATDGAGDAFVTGSTPSAGFPVTSTALPSGAAVSAFVTKISDATAACSTLSVSPGSALASPFIGTLTFTVVAPSGCAWTASSNAAWAVVTSGVSGTGSGTVTVQISASSNTATQSATLTVGSQNVTITLPGNLCFLFTANASNNPVPAAGGHVVVSLTNSTIVNGQIVLGGECPWTVTNNYAGAISFTSPSSGTGSATIDLTVTPNGSPVGRIFSLPVGTTEIQITQLAGGQSINCGNYNPPNPVIRAEGETELVTDYITSCISSVGANSTGVGDTESRNGKFLFFVPPF